MSFLLIIRRSGAIARSVLPADPTSWLLLLGAIFLFISRNLAWWPRSISNLYRTVEWAGYSHTMSLPILAAGIVGYYLALVGAKNPARRLLDSVLLPAAVGLVANLVLAFLWFGDVVEPAHFLNQPPDIHQLWEPRVLRTLAANLGAGFQFASVGFILVAVFFILYIWGRATLPVHLPSESISDASSSGDEHRSTMFFVWIMVAMVFLPWVFEAALAYVGDWIFPHFTWPHAAWTSWPPFLLHHFLLFVVFVLAAGKCLRKTIPAMFRIPRAKYLAIAISIPAAFAYVGPVASYLHARMIWTNHGWGKYVPPSPSTFFGIPEVASAPYFIPALVGEIAWRGYLQPRFIRRYGLVRGIFLIGVVWGAFHFFWDFDSRMAAQNVCIDVLGRLAGTISFSYVLAWLTIRSESILPAAVAHATYNAFTTARSLPIHTPHWLTFLLWLIAGFALFYFFPPPSPTTVTESAIPPAPEPEPSEV